MKLRYGFLATSAFIASLLFVNGIYAQDTTVTLQGTIIDNKCATAHKDNLPEFIKTHTKDCALMPDCVSSGYALYADGNLMQFDKASNAKVENFLKMKENTLSVVVEAKPTEINAISIKNAPSSNEKKAGGKIMEMGKDKAMEQGTKKVMEKSVPKVPKMP